MAREETQEALILKSIDFKDRQRIITLFTPESGVISLIVKGLTQKKPHLFTLTTPFIHAEFQYRVGRSDLYSFRDGTTLNTHDNLKDQLKSLLAASQIIDAIHSTQMPEKPAPLLFRLALTYFKKIPTFDDPRILKASFLLKLLKHDGHLNITPHCSHCKNEPTHLFHGELLCDSHATPSAHPIKKEEWQTLNILANSREIALLQSISLSDELEELVTEIFKEKTAH